MNLKRIIKKITPKRFLNYLASLHGAFVHKGKISSFEFLKSFHFVSYKRSVDFTEAYSLQFLRVAKYINIPFINGFYYPLDRLVTREIPSFCQPILSMTVDFGRVLDSNLNNLVNFLIDCKDVQFRKAEMNVLEGIELLGRRISSLKGKSEREIEVRNWFPELLFGKPKSFDQALQKILFYDALFWQMGHRHIGLGRLDLCLYEYYDTDIKNGLLTREDAKRLICNFLRALHENYIFKSVALIGDTGQYILLGGIDADGNIIDNDLTLLFLEILTEINLPDPKLILRVNNNTDNKVWMKAINCIATGCGSPLLMNEKLIMDGMTKFGYKRCDVWNIGTSACWEPLIIGKSFDQNNPLPSITIIKSLNSALDKVDCSASFDDIIEAFKREATIQIKESIHDVQFDVSPLFSLFFNSCFDKGIDYTRGGADYSYHGVQIVSFPNLVNSLLNLKYYVYDHQILTISQCKDLVKNNFEGKEDIRELLLSNKLKYGSTNTEVVQLTNSLMKFLSLEVGKYKINNQKVKMGFCSPQYITNSREVLASLDGRKDYSPFAVHISPVSHEIDIQEVLDFAGKLDYGENRLNGNVVDFILPSSYINNPLKLIQILRHAMTSGVYELQLNVLDKNTLIDAKNHPEKYPNLIVRVWGFSAYFNDLPDSYKDYLIQRAEYYHAN